MSKDHEGIDQPTLFAHLMKLSQDEAAAAAAAPAKTATKKEAAPRMLPGKASTPSDDLATFKRDSADVRRWMKHALEDLHIDTMVVASAAVLASQYLRRRYWLRSTYRGSVGGDGGGVGDNSDLHRGSSRKSAAASLRAFSAAPAAHVAAGDVKGGRRRVGRRASGRSGKGGVKTVLLSVTCIHLATKYHAGCDDPVAGFGARIKLNSVIKLGLDISLSMGTFLNASFRANPVALQALFCNTADESAVVRACSEWFALCLVLLLHPSDEVDERPTTQRGQRTPSPSTSIGTGSTSSCSTSPASSALDANDTTTSPRTPSCRNFNDLSVAEQRGTGLTHRRFSRATSLALGALVLARRLARSEGPCLPLRVRDLICVDNDESLQLVEEGINAARSAFETTVVDAISDSAEGEDNEEGGAGVAGDGGWDILAGDIVFGRIIADVPPNDRVVNPSGDSARVSAKAERRTLLEWVSACRGDTQAPPNTASGAGQVCPGEALACDEELSYLNKAPIRDGDKTADEGYVSFVRGIPLSVEEAMGSAPLSPGGADSLGSPSPKSDNDNAVGARGCEDSADSLAYSESAKSSTDGNEEKEEEEGEEMGDDDDDEEESETQSKRSTASEGTDEDNVPSSKLPRKRGMSSDMDDHTDLSESPYPSPSSPMDVSRAPTSSHRIPWKIRTPSNKVSSPYSPGTDNVPAPVFLGDAMDVVGGVETSPPPRRPFSPTASITSTGSDSELAAYLAKKVAATRRSSRKRWLSSEQMVNDAGQREGQRPTKRYRTTRRKASSQEDRLRLRSATSKQEERDARWEIMKDRVVAALEYRCGCSFCKLRDDGGSRSTTAA